MKKIRANSSVDNMIQGAIDRQNNWRTHRRAVTSVFMRDFNATHNQTTNKNKEVSKKNNVLKNYWFPLTCAILSVIVAIVVMVMKVSSPATILIPETSVVQEIKQEQINYPTFDLVRVEKNGNILIAGRWKPNTHIKVKLNKKDTYLTKTNERGEFVYVSPNNLVAGNYVISLFGVEDNIESENTVFVYVSENGYKNSVSLLITKDGSSILQAPELVDGDLVVSKIDYLENGRIVITGKALPRLRISLTLNGKYIGFTRVSDYKNFGLGADVGKLTPGQEYELKVRLHDGNGTTIASVVHTFIMPEMTGDDDTFYTVRKGDCLWVIARNFLRKGVLFSIIADRNNIVNPDLIFPKQQLQIPVSEE